MFHYYLLLGDTQITISCTSLVCAVRYYDLSKDHYPIWNVIMLCCSFLLTLWTSVYGCYTSFWIYPPSSRCSWRCLLTRFRQCIGCSICQGLDSWFCFCSYSTVVVMPCQAWFIFLLWATIVASMVLVQENYIVIVFSVKNLG